MSTRVATARPSAPALADRSPESRGRQRDEVRLLVSATTGERDLSFRSLPDLLAPGDLLVVNESATLPASLPAVGPIGEFRLHLATEFGDGLWLTEPRWSPARPGPLPLADGTAIAAGGVPATVVARYPGIARLAFVRFEGDVPAAMSIYGEPIRYGYLRVPEPLERYQTVFARVPGSAEMPSAGRPFSTRILEAARRRGIGIASVVLHAGVSSLEPGDIVTGAPPLLPEPYAVPAATVEAIARTRRAGGRVIAVGTTVVRALESAHDGCSLRPSRGFSRRYVSPAQPPVVADGLISGLHAEGTTHLDLLDAFLGRAARERAYAHARAAGYLWHEFGDVHLSFRPARA